MIGVQGWIFYLVRSNKIERLSDLFQVVRSRFFIVFTTILLLAFTAFYLTKFWIVANTPLWNVPGVPVSGLQMFLSMLPITGLLIIEVTSKRFEGWFNRKGGQALVIGLIFLATILAWGLTPLKGDSLAVSQSVANPQPYPQHDARVHDIGALSILFGEGINSKQYTDKPLYMVILALFHLVSGYDYNLLQWVQVIFLALIPVLAYLLGKKFHTPFFGILMAVLIILQQRNAVILSRKISSVNVKILATEEFVLLGMLILAFLLFNWNEKNDQRNLLLAGGMVAMLSLIRLNPLIFLPFISLVIIIHYRKHSRLLWSRLMIFLLGFVIVFSPWVISGKDAQGQSFILVKIRDVIENRIAPQVGLEEVDRAPLVSSPGSEIPLETFTSAGLHLNRNGFVDSIRLARKALAVKTVVASTQYPEFAHYTQLVAEHFVHNLVTSVIPLPDVLSRDGIQVLAQRDYWNDLMAWDGRLSGGLLRFLGINLLLFSLGVASGWRSWHWKGLIPLGMFVVYDLAISVSLTSGGRYIVPIIWVVFFYYALGLVFLIETIIRLFHPASPIEEQGWIEQPQSVKPPRVLPGLIGLLIVALMIPVANQGIPLLVTQTPVEKARQLFKSQGSPKQPGLKYKTGILLYPVYDPLMGKVTFDLFQKDGVDEVSFELFPPQGASVVMNTQLQSGEPVRLETDARGQLSGIFIFREDKMIRYWSLTDIAGVH